MTEIAMNSPYRGLTPYTEADAAYFFGRTAEIATITANLEVARLTLFYGPSGVGKSSVLRAGVIRKLIDRAQENFAVSGMAEQIPIYFNRWASDPRLGLSQALAAAVQPYCATPNDPLPLLDAPLLDQLHYWSQATNSELLLVLDQFEEFFQYHLPAGGAWDPTGFGAQLVQIVNHSVLPVNVLLSLREDALARLDYFQGRIPALLDNRLSLGHLDRAAGHEAIVEPLARFNQEHNSHYTLDDDLVTAVLDQVGSGQVALSRQGAGGRSVMTDDGQVAAATLIEAPYLQLVMTRLWQKEQDESSLTLRLTTLNEKLGGAETIVRNYLDDTLDALTADDRDLAARFFDRLVTPSGAKIALSLAELAHYAGSPETAIETILQQLQDRRLLRGIQAPSGVTQYEIFHDVLGPALLDWQERYQKARQAQQRLTAAQAERVEAERRAQEAEERANLQAEARQQAQARATAEAERAEAEAKRTRQARWAVAGLALLLLLALGTAVWAWVERQSTKTAQANAVVQEQKAIAAADARATEVAVRSTAQAEAVSEGLRADQNALTAVAAANARATEVAVRSTAQAEVESEKIRADQNALTAIAAANARATEVVVRSTAQAEVESERIRADQGALTAVAAANARATEVAVRSTAQAEVESERIRADQSALTAIAAANARSTEVAVRSTAQADAESERIRANQNALTAIAAADARATEVAIRSTAQADAESERVRADQNASTAVAAANARATEVAKVSAAQAQAESAKLLAEFQQRKSQANSLAAQSLQVAIHGDPTGDLSLILAREAVLTTFTADKYFTISADDALRTAVNQAAWLRTKKIPQTEQCRTLALDLNAQKVYIGCDNGFVRVWNMSSGDLEVGNCWHENEVLSVSLSADNAHLVTAGGDGKFCLWNLQSGEVRVSEKMGKIWSATFNPQGNRIVTAGEDKIIRIWDANSLQLLNPPLVGHTGTVYAAMFSYDGTKIVSSSSDKTIRLWDVATHQQIGGPFEGHQGEIRSVAFKHDNSQIVSASDDRTIRIWGVATHRELRQLQGHTETVRMASFSPDDTRILSASADKTIRIWDANLGQELFQLHGHTDTVYSAIYSLDGKFIISSGEDQTVRLWNATIPDKLYTLNGHTAKVLDIDFSPDGRLLVSVSADTTAHIWDLATGKTLITMPHSAAVRATAFSPNGNTIATASDDGVIHLWRASDGAEPLWQAELPTSDNLRTIRSVVFSPAEPFLMSSGDDATVRIWNADTGYEICHFLSDGGKPIRTAVFNPISPRMVAVAGDDGAVEIWSFSLDGCKREWINDLPASNPIYSVRFHPNGKQVVIAGENQPIRIWTIENQFVNFLGNTTTNWEAVFSPDGTHISFGGDDNAVYIWASSSNQPLRQLQGHTQSVLTVAYSPDGKMIASGSDDFTIRLWVADIEDLLAMAAKRIQREPPELAPDERRQFGLE